MKEIMLYKSNNYTVIQVEPDKEKFPIKSQIKSLATIMNWLIGSRVLAELVIYIAKETNTDPVKVQFALSKWLDKNSLQ